MNIVLIIIVMFLSMVIGLLLLIWNYTEGDSVPAKVSGYSLCTLSFGLMMWIAYVSWQPAEVFRELEISPSKLDNQDNTYSQMIAFTDKNGNRVVRNCNDIFSGVLPEGSTVIVRELKEYYYCGISYTGTEVNSLQTQYLLKKAVR